MYKTYSELIKIKSFEDRFAYLSLHGLVGNMTFGGHRYLNQKLYQSKEWNCVKREVIIRDNGCDLAHNDFPIHGSIYIHHINPITINDIIDRNPLVFDLENLICTTFDTHNALHYGSKNIPYSMPISRKSGDTRLW